MRPRPAGWRQVRLEDVILSLRNGIFARRPNADGRGTAILRISAVRHGVVNVHDRRHVEDVLPEDQGRFALNEGDLLFTRYNGTRALVGICGRVGPITETVLHPDKLIRVVPDGELVDDRFLSLQMQTESVRQFLEPRIRTTAGQSGITGSDIRAIPVALPPLAEQHRIVAVLEDHLSRLDAARTYITGVGARTHALRESLLSAESAGLPRLQVRELISRPLANGRSVPDGDGAPVLRLTALRDGQVDLQEYKRGRWTPDEAEPFTVHDDDVLVSRGNGSLNRVARGGLVDRVSVPVAFPDTMIRIRVDANRLHPSVFLAFWNGRQVRRQIETRARTTAGIYKVNQQQLLDVQVPVPPKDRQTALLEALRDAEGTQGRLSCDLRKAAAGTERLRSALLSAAFAGSL